MEISPAPGSPGTGTSSVSWVGPYVIRWDDADIITETGRVLFTPTVGSFLMAWMLDVVEPFVGADGENPRLAIGSWNNAQQDVLGPDTDLPVDAGSGVGPWTGTDFTRPGYIATRYFNGPSRFTTAHPIYVNVIDGNQDVAEEKPSPPCASLSAGIVHLYLQFMTPDAP